MNINNIKQLLDYYDRTKRRKEKSVIKANKSKDLNDIANSIDLCNKLDEQKTKLIYLITQL
jgi:hypothetical protein